jgi:hypothetical protein
MLTKFLIVALIEGALLVLLVSGWWVYRYLRDMIIATPADHADSWSRRDRDSVVPPESRS